MCEVTQVTKVHAEILLLPNTVYYSMEKIADVPFDCGADVEGAKNTPSVFLKVHMKRVWDKYVLCSLKRH